VFNVYISHIHVYRIYVLVFVLSVSSDGLKRWAYCGHMPPRYLELGLSLSLKFKVGRCGCRLVARIMASHVVTQQFSAP
jgi:hypothetical protein